ncbi:hypothetical protein SAMN04488136_11676 [Vibrio xiamenensis]|uniref:Uncharacterized protein n=1 Tax=Vibrio xiamenensis TaxID=861298 RepID=A0A1G8CHS8_9VIBR|nr:hypothetical protein [Vibrio xiamenensis]SDH45017.1 hypothetical protein SAMN04488136_11676 [Vibrio xiamenensis]
MNNEIRANEAQRKLQRLCFQSGDRHLINWSTEYFGVIDGLSRHLPSDLIPLEVEWQVRFDNRIEHDAMNSSKEEIGLCLQETLGESSLTRLYVENESGEIWNPAVKSFNEFENGSHQIKVSKLNECQFDLMEILGGSH